MKEDIGMSKPKKHANKVGKLTQDSKSLLHTYVHCCTKYKDLYSLCRDGTEKKWPPIHGTAAEMNVKIENTYRFVYSIGNIVSSTKVYLYWPHITNGPLMLLCNLNN